MAAFGDNIDIPFQVPQDCFDPERAFAALGFADLHCADAEETTVVANDP